MALREGCQGRCFRASVSVLSPGVSAIAVAEPSDKRRAQPDSAPALLSSAASYWHMAAPWKLEIRKGLLGRWLPGGWAAAF